jgi:hypothetical protein
MRVFIFSMLSIYSLILLTWSGEAAIREYLKQGQPTASSVDRITLFSQQAKVVRLGRLEKIKAGKGATWVHLQGLSGNLKKDSIRVSINRGDGSRISQVVIEDFYDFAPMTPYIFKMRSKLYQLYGAKLDLIQQERLGQHEITFFNQLKYFYLPGSVEDFPSFSASPKTLGSAIKTLGQARDKAFLQLQELKAKRKKNQEEIRFIQKQLQNHTDLRKQKWMTHIFVLVEHPVKWDHLQGKMEVSYLIDGANWKPIYDIRTRLDKKKGQAKIRLVTSGLVSQKSDELWSNVALSFSTATPSPLFTRKLNRWIFQEQRVEAPQIVRDESISNFAGAAMDKLSDSSFMQKESRQRAPKKRVKSRRRHKAKRRHKEKMVAPSSQLMEAKGMMASSAPPPPRGKGGGDKFFPLQSLDRIFPGLNQAVNRIERIEKSEVRGRLFDGTVGNYHQRVGFPEVGGRRITLKAPLRATIEHHQAAVKIPIMTQSIDAKLLYFSIPKRDTRVYLQAHAQNQGKYPLLNGEAQVFMNGDMVSRTSLRNISAGSHFTINLGEDPNVITKRVVSKESNTTGMIVKGHSTVVKVEVEVSNHHQFPIQLTMKDNYPLSPHDDLVVKLLTVSPKPTNTVKGVMSWKSLTIGGGKKRSIKFSYQVEHPKDWIISEFN